ncbi:DUF2975 domain-containing protein [Aquisalibacillus elongatus]|uniref:DUF2975 family protein n=1 Tax=Aquisalibacillus elongatus TaxID=485577 RepID=A0A3N5B810_9BACI|nr:DUF2975 domain-containing protein [Aquisalibacillus elongatus]RPF53457.1 DUF2975 family protein [Aquisalibacillus elongatus]
MKKSSTTFLKLVIILIGLAVLTVCVTVLPMVAINLADNPTFVKWVMYPIIIGMYVSAIPFFYALYQAWRLLTYIDHNEAFSDLSVHALKIIKQCALTISGVYVLMMPLIYIFGEKDDAPGVILMGLVIIFASFVIAVFASVLQKVMKSALEIKTENDLTV